MEPNRLEPTISDRAEIKGLGAIPHAGGVAFRVWAPHAQRVSIIGTFNGWENDKHPMQAEGNGCWFADVAAAHIGDQYKFLLTTAHGEFKRIDPYAREVTATGKATAKPSEVMQVPMWLRNRASTTDCPATRRFRWVPTVC